MAQELEQTNIKRSKAAEWQFRPMSNFDGMSTAYQLCVKADALRVAKLYQEAVGRYLNAILIDRENADSYYGLGMCYKNLNRVDKAIQAFEKAQKIREMDFSICYELGVCYLVTGEICLAMKNLVKSLKLNPKNLNAQIQLAMAHEIVDEKDLALMIYQKIIETKPSYMKAYNHKSALLMGMGEYREASVILNKTLKLNPDYHRAYLGIAICFDKMGKSADAIRYYRKFLEHKPNSYHALFVKTRLAELKSGIKNLKNNFSSPILTLIGFKDDGDIIA